MLNDMIDDLTFLFGRLGGTDPPIPCTLPNGTDVTGDAILYRAFNRIYKEHRDWFIETGPPRFLHRRYGIRSRYKARS